MLVSGEQHQYDISFSYYTINDPRRGTRRVVVARVQVYDGNNRLEQTVVADDGDLQPATILRGRAITAPSDHYRKSYGRKLALKRAIVHLPADRRRDIWHGLFNLGFRKQ